MPPPIATEAAILLDLESVSRTVRSGQVIVHKGRRCNAIFLITEGIAIRYRILRDGQRWILNCLLPGDFGEVTGCRYENALYSIKTVTPATFSPIPLHQLRNLVDAHPRFAAKLFWSLSCETAILRERLITVTRRSATERVAHLLLELLIRLQRVGLANEYSYRLPLTRDMIGDMLGLSGRAVNGALRQLRTSGLVRIQDRLVVVQEIDALMTLSDFKRMYLEPLSI
jgi:CRP-like cAMP-binding protein